MNEHIAALLKAVAMDGHISRPSLYQDGMVLPVQQFTGYLYTVVARCLLIN